MGRPGKYETHVKPRLNSIIAWKRKGLTNKEIVKNLGIGGSNFTAYQNQYKEFKAALKTGKSDADAQVENALFRRAIGYEYDEIMETTTKRKDGTVSTYKKTTKKFIPPDNIAIIFYLKNRMSSDWHDRKQHEIGSIDGKPLANVHVILPDNGMNKDDD